MQVSAMRRNAPITSPAFLSYTVQNSLLQRNIEPQQWLLLSDDAKQYQMNVSTNIDKAFMYEDFPPGNPNLRWTTGRRSQFELAFYDWVRSRVDPRKHWGLFSLFIRGKTGYQCRFYFLMCTAAHEKYPEVESEDDMALREKEDTAFRAIVFHVCQQFKATPAPTMVCNSVTEFPGRKIQVGGTRCYASSVLQFLTRMQELMDLLQRQIVVPRHNTCRLAADLLELRRNIGLPGPPISIQHILDQLWFNWREQQDVHEFYLAVIDRLASEMEGTHRMELSEMFDAEYVWPDDLDKTKLYRVKTRCIELPTPEEDDTLDELLASFLSDNRLEKFPKLIALHINRNKVTMPVFEREHNDEFITEKTMVDIRCPEELYFNSMRYQLVFTVLHSGASSEYGHYIGIIRGTTYAVYVDGGNVSFLSPQDSTRQQKIAESQVCFVVYQRDIHVQSSFSLPAGNPPAHIDGTAHQSAAWTLGRQYVMHGTSVKRTRRTSQPDAISEFTKELMSYIETTKREMHYLSDKDKIFISHMAGKGLSLSEIAEMIQRHRATVGRFLRSPIGLEPATRDTMINDKRLQSIILNESKDIDGKRLSCKRLAQMMKDKHGVEISKETVRQLRRAIGMRFLRPIPQCDMTDVHKANRVVFAVDWIEKRTNLMRRTPIIFSDESKLCLTDNGNRLWRIPGECCECEYISRRQHPVQVMIWACVGVGHKSELFRFEETCNKETYMRLLTDNGIFAKLNAKFGEKQYVFQQDNAPPHVARQTLAWLEEQTILLKGWPPHSPDLNPIEILWAITKAKINVIGIKNDDELFARAYAVWHDMSQEIVDNVCSSFEARLRTVIHLRGNTLNGHWTLVHKVHMLIKNTNIKEIDAKVEDLFRNPDGYTVKTGDDDPLLEISRMDTEILSEMNSTQSNDEIETESSEEQTEDEFGCDFHTLPEPEDTNADRQPTPSRPVRRGINLRELFEKFKSLFTNIVSFPR